MKSAFYLFRLLPLTLLVGSCGENPVSDIEVKPSLPEEEPIADPAKEPMDPETKSKLLAAIKQGNLAGVKNCLANDVDVNEKLSSFDETALHLAAGEGHREIVELLISTGADVNRLSSFPLNDGSRRTPLDNARFQMYGFGNATPPANLPRDHSHHKFKAIADVLKKAGGHSGSIFVAAESGDILGVKALLKKSRLDLNKTNTGGRTLLHLAAENGHKGIVSLFLDAGAQVDFGNWADQTALHYAAKNGHTEVIELLISRGAKVNALGGALNGTPLDFARRFKRNKASAFLRSKKAKTGEELENKEK